MGKEFWTVSDIAGAVGLTVQAVRKHLHNGSLIGIQLPAESNRPGQWVVERDQALAYLERQRRPSSRRGPAGACSECRETAAQLVELREAAERSQVSLLRLVEELQRLAGEAAASQLQVAQLGVTLTRLLSEVTAGPPQGVR